MTGKSLWLKKEIAKHKSLSRMTYAAIGRMIQEHFGFTERAVTSWVKSERDPDQFKRQAIAQYLTQLAAQQNTVTQNSPLKEPPSLGRLFS